MQGGAAQRAATRRRYVPPLRAAGAHRRLEDALDLRAQARRGAAVVDHVVGAAAQTAVFEGDADQIITLTGRTPRWISCPSGAYL
jgi:hypothetical protein